MQSSVLQDGRPSACGGATIAGQAESVTSQIAARAVASPTKTAIVEDRFALSFGELETRSNQLAAYLWEMGAGRESCVAVVMERSSQFVIAALAVLKTGAAYLPIDPSTPADRINFILADAGAKIVLTHRQKSRCISAPNVRIIQLDDADAQQILARPTTRVQIHPDANSLAYVIYTSGSTGRPKGVEITHANLSNLIAWHNAAFAVTPEDRASQVAGLGFDAAVWEIWPHLAAGAALYLAAEDTRRSPQALREWIIREKITISFVPTVLAEQLLHTAWPADAALRIFLTGADTLHRRPAEGLPFVLVNNYGPTECTVVSTSGIVNPEAVQTAANAKPSIGRPIPGAEIFILDDSQQAVARGEAGELCVAGPHVGRGYRNNPELSAAKFIHFTAAPGAASKRIYKTGDRARFLESGEIEFLGRLDDQVKIRGYRIELGEIAARLDRYPGVQASTAVAVDSEGGPALLAYLVVAPGAQFNAGDLREFLAEKLPDYMIPARFVSISELPTTANGKLDKSALPAPSAANLIPGRAAVAAPAATAAADNAIQSRIASLVAALLEQPAVGPEENFFMIGGHSMLGVQLVARIRDMFGVKLTLRQLFGAPTVAALAAEVTRLTAKP